MLCDLKLAHGEVELRMCSVRFEISIASNLKFPGNVIPSSFQVHQGSMRKELDGVDNSVFVGDSICLTAPSSYLLEHVLLSSAQVCSM